MRILVVDDDHSVRGVVESVLEDDGHEVAAFDNAEAALEAYKKAPFLFVITDIVMGGMTGLQLLKEVKHINADTHVVIMTSHSSVEFAIEALKSGAYDYFEKPFENLDIISHTANRAIRNIELTLERQNLIDMLQKKNEELQVLNGKLHRMATHDPLTGLYNRSYFQTAIQTEISRAIRYQRDLALLFMDIDYFKKYNDDYGHQNGDLVLQGVAEIIDTGSRSHDIATRYGGEEFILLMPEINSEQACQYAKRLGKAVAEAEFIGTESQVLEQVTLSIGVANLQQGVTNPEELIRRADKALYRAKNMGRNQVCVAED